MPEAIIGRESFVAKISPQSTSQSQFPRSPKNCSNALSLNKGEKDKTRTHIPGPKCVPPFEQEEELLLFLSQPEPPGWTMGCREKRRKE